MKHLFYSFVLVIINSLIVFCSNRVNCDLNIDELAENVNDMVIVNDEISAVQRSNYFVEDSHLNFLTSNDDNVFYSGIHIINNMPYEDKKQLDSFKILVTTLNFDLRHDLLIELFRSLGQEALNKTDSFGSSILFFVRSADQAHITASYGCDIFLKNVFGVDAMEEHLRWGRNDIAETLKIFKINSLKERRNNFDEVFNYGL